MHNDNLLALLKKYDQEGPRYTSYPPAPVFSEAFGPKEYQTHIAAVNSVDKANEISLYLHLPFCDTLCYFCGCTMLISNDRARIHTYVEYIKREVSFVAKQIAPSTRVVQMHWGGGSPTHLTPAEIADLGLHVRKEFTFASDAEVSIEIDPRGLTLDHILALEKVGFNRASIGVQDFDPHVQQAVNRVQPEAMTRQVIEWCRAHGMQNINLDLIYGLPYQTAESFEHTLDLILGLNPDRLAIYNIAYLPRLKPHQRLIEIETLPAAKEKLNLLGLAITRLEQAGFEYIGMDHFARPNDELAIARREGTLQRNFQGYSTRAGADLYGFGMSSISRVGNCFAQNVKTIPEYYQAIDERRFATHAGYQMSKDDEIRERVIMELMCALHLNIPELEEAFGIEFQDYFSSSIAMLDQFEADSLVVVTNSAIEILPLGRFFLRNIAMTFDAYLTELRKTKKLFSRTV